MFHILKLAPAGRLQGVKSRLDLLEGCAQRGPGPPDEPKLAEHKSVLLEQQAWGCSLSVWVQLQRFLQPDKLMSKASALKLGQLAVQYPSVLHTLRHTSKLMPQKITNGAHCAR